MDDVSLIYDASRSQTGRSVVGGGCVQFVELRGHVSTVAGCVMDDMEENFRATHRTRAAPDEFTRYFLMPVS